MLFIIVTRGFVRGNALRWTESVEVREQLSTSAFTMWKQHPWIGVGLGNFLVTLPDFLPSRQIYFLQPVHAIYLLVLSELGIVGFVAFCVLLWKLIERGQWAVPIFLAKKFWGNLTIKSVYTVAFFSLLIIGFFDHYPLTLQQGQLLFTILLALSAQENAN